MVRVDASLWTVLNVAGMILLAAGALTVIFAKYPNPTVSAMFMVAGIIFIVVSAVFVSSDGRKLRKEDEEFRRFEKIRDDARLIPNDLKEGYLIDYTADPENAISYKDNEPEQVHEERCEEHSGDIQNVYSS